MWAGWKIELVFLIYLTLFVMFGGCTFMPDVPPEYRAPMQQIQKEMNYKREPDGQDNWAVGFREGDCEDFSIRFMELVPGSTLMLCDVPGQTSHAVVKTPTGILLDPTSSFAYGECDFLGECRRVGDLAICSNGSKTWIKTIKTNGSVQ